MNPAAWIDPACYLQGTCQSLRPYLGHEDRLGLVRFDGFSQIAVGPKPFDDSLVGVPQGCGSSPKCAIRTILGTQLKRILPRFSRLPGTRNLLGDAVTVVGMVYHLPAVSLHLFQCCSG